jgi:membrane protease YdiL (CAAX protease family)
MRINSPIVGITQWLAFLGGWALCFGALQVGVVGAWLYMADQPATLDGVLGLVAQPVPTGLTLGAMTVQFTMMLGLAGLVHAGGLMFAGRTAKKGPVPVEGWMAAVIGGLTIGFFPAQMASLIRETWPALDMGALAAVTDILSEGSTLEVAAFVAIAAVFGPVVEEVVFRGVLWKALEGWTSPAIAIGATTFAFCAFHLDPSQAVPLISTGLFFGLLRAATGSLIPCIAAHVLNNTLAVSFGWMGVQNSSMSFACIALIAGGSLGWAAWHARPAYAEVTA